MHIGLRIKELRESRKIQQKVLAQKIGVRQATLSEWESGENEPNPANRKIVAKFFGISESELFGGPSPRPIEIKDVKIPIVSMAKGDDMTGFEFEQLEPHNYEYLDFKNCKAVRIGGNSMAPLAYANQLVIYSEEEPVKDGDLVFIGLKKKGQFFKRYHKDAKNGIVTLLSINIAHHGPIISKSDEIDFMYRVVGVKF